MFGLGFDGWLWSYCFMSSPLCYLSRYALFSHINRHTYGRQNEQVTSPTDWMLVPTLILFENIPSLLCVSPDFPYTQLYICAAFLRSPHWRAPYISERTMLSLCSSLAHRRTVCCTLSMSVFWQWHISCAASMVRDCSGSFRTQTNLYFDDIRKKNRKANLLTNAEKITLCTSKRHAGAKMNANVKSCVMAVDRCVSESGLEYWWRTLEDGMCPRDVHCSVKPAQTQTLLRGHLMNSDTSLF